MRTQTIQAPMHVVQSTGDVMVVLADGSTRPVHQGEMLPAGTVLQLADNATVQLEPSTAAAQPDVMVPATDAQWIPATGTTAEIAAIQQALLQGIDPTLNLEATAAGGAPAAGGGGAGGSGNGGFVAIDRTGDETLATAGFDTSYQSGLLAETPDPFAAEAAVVVVPPPVIDPDPAALSETNLTTDGLNDVDLVDGSTPGEAPTSLTGNLNVDFGGGSGAVTFLPIDSQPVLSSGGEPIVWTLSDDGQTLVGSVNGDVILTVILAADGSSYTVDLDGPLDHGEGSLQMSFGIQAINLAGESAVGLIGLTIADDEPLATDNNSSLSEDSLQVEGNVLLDDRLGADGAAVTPLDLDDDYGRLTMDAAGQYIYTLNTQDPVVQALDAGESLVREFPYTLTDGDGDVSTATLTITITGSNDIPTIEAHGEGLGVSETGLPDGSGIAADAQASGSFSIGDSDGLDDIKSLTIAGTTLNVAAGQTVADLVGSVVNTPYGQLTLDSFDADTGTFGYSYQLLNNVDNDSQQGADADGFSETISLSVSDGTNSAETSFGVYIADDTVNAEDDGPFTVTEDAEFPLNTISGNVLDNDLHANGEPGADDRSFTGWTTPPSILTQYGTLVLGADGSYSFELDNSLPATQGLSSQDVISETFSYGITDSDGDTDTATLTIRIQGSNDVVVINDLDGNEVAVSDANLPDGSAEDASLLTVDKSFTFSAPDGVKSLMVGDVELIHEGVVTTLPATVTSGLGNTMVITGVVFDPATGAGTVSYSYTLLDNEFHTQPANDTSLGESFSVVLVDDDNTALTKSLDVTVADDTVNAVNDGPFTVTEDAEFPLNTISGNVLDNDLHANGEPGADDRSFTGWTTPPSILTQYGTLVLGADGSYSFELDNSLPATQGLSSQDVISETFSYGITDSDGDTDTASLTIRIQGTNDVVVINDLDGNEVAVSDANLPDGSAEDASLLTVDKSFTFSAPDGVKSLMVGDVELIHEGVVTTLPATVTSGLGNTMVITGVVFDPATGAGTVSYSYTLLDNEFHTKPANDTSLGESFSVVLVDDDNTSLTKSLDVTVADDTVNAVNDGPFTVTEDAEFPLNTISGNVLDNDLHANGEPGADDRSFTGWTTPPSILTQYGTLVLGADGSYSFELDNSLPATQGLSSQDVISETFSYGITDSDGDTDTASLTIRIQGTNDVVVINDLDGNEVAVSDANLPDGSAEDASLLTVDKSFTFSAPDGVKSLMVGDVELIHEGVVTTLPATVTSGLGNSLVITGVVFDPATGAGTVSYSYTLLDNEFHTQPANDTSLGESFSVVLVDDDNTALTKSLDVTVADDTVNAVNDGPFTVTEDAEFPLNTISGNVLDNDLHANGEPGADDRSFTGWTTPPSILTQYGTLVLGADGSYSFELDNSLPATQGLSSQDVISETFSYGITDSDGDTDTATLTIRIQGTNDVVVINDLDGNEVAVSDANLPDGSAEDASLLTVDKSFTFSAPDGVKSLMVGDVELIHEGVVTTLPATVTSGLGNTMVITGVVFDPATGAGTVSYSYTLLDNEFHTQPANDTSLGESFSVVLVDDDNTSLTKSLDVTVADDTVNAVNDGPFTVTEDAEFPLNTISGNVLDNDLHANGEPGADDRSFAGWTTPPSILTQYGTLVLGADGSYSFELDNSLPATQGLSSQDVISETFSYGITDSDGDTDTATLTIRIQGSNDVVVINDLDGNEVAVSDANLPDGSAEDASLLTVDKSFTFSAPDGVKSLMVGDVELIHEGVVTTLPATVTSGLGNSLVITGVVFDPATGAGTVSYSYTLLDNEFHTQPANDTSLGESFSVVLVDDDNTALTKSLDVTVADDTVNAVNDGPFTVTEDAEFPLNTISGNVLDNDLHANGEPGADDRSFTGWTTPPSILTQYGTLVLGADGSYSFELDNSLPATQGLSSQDVISETFSYGITDSDGDTDTATLTIRIQGTNDVVVINDLDGNEVAVSDANLPDGSAEDASLLTVDKSFTFSAPDGVKSLMVGDVELIHEGVVTTLPATVTSGLGNTMVITGVVFDPATGAGTVSYSYTLLDNEFHTKPANDTSLGESFSVVLVDDDNTSLTKSLDVTVADDTVNAVNDGPFTVTEDAEFPLNTISGNVLDNDLHANGEPGADDRSFTGWTTPPSILTQYGTLVLGADGSYSFELDNSLPATQGLSSQDVISETFSYGITDSDGDTDTASLTIRIQGTNDVVVINDLDGNEVAVSDANLPDGSAEDASLLTVDKSFTFSAPDGVKSLMVGDVELIHEGVVTTLPATVTSGLGNTMVITGVVFDPATGAGTVSYSYTLLDNEFHTQPANDTSLGESFSVVLVDDDNTALTKSLDVTVADDTVNAVNDGPFTVTEDAEFPLNTISGNVLDNDLHANGEPGADDRSFTGWTTPPSILTQYGTLVLGADGSYSFELDNSLPATQGLSSQDVISETFSYGITDSDGDTDTASLTIRIQGTNDVVVINDLDGNEVAVSDANLPDGSAEDASLLTVDKSFTFSAPDGVKSLMVGDVELIHEGVVTTLPATVTSGLGNTMVITGVVFDPATGAGTVSYSYTLLDNEFHTKPANDTSLGESFSVVLVDDDNTSLTKSLDVTVADDTVNAVNDGPFTVTEDAEFPLNTISGNVLDNDLHANGEPGADDRSFTGWTTPPSILTQYGTLVLGADGSYSFELDNSLPATQGLSSQDVISETFSYGITDSDGDTDTASLTIRIQGTNDVVVINDLDGNEVAVSDANLPDGSAEDASLLTVDKSFTFSAPDGVKSLMVGDVELIHEGVVTTLPATVTSGLGNTMVITGVVFDPATGAGTVSYSYTLLDNEFHTKPANDTSLGESFSVVLVDDDNTSLTKSLDVTVADDMPALTSVQSAVVENSADAPDFLGTSTLLMGADQPGHADLTANITGWDGAGTTWGISTLTSGEHPIYYFVDPDDTSVLYAYTSPLAGPYNPATSDLIFTLSYGVDGHYTLNMDGTIDAPKHIYTDTFDENIGGNFDYLLLASDGTLYKPTDTLPVDANIVMTIDSSGTSTVNSSTQGLGISNGWITASEDLILKFTNPVVSAQFSIDTQSGDATNMVTWTVHGMAADGTLTTQSGTTSFSDGVLTTIPTTLTHITQIELSDEAGPGYRVSGTNLVYRIEEEPVSTDLAVAIVDEDGDKASGTLAVTFTPAVEDALVVGSNADDVSGSTVPYVTPGDFGVIEGGKGDDILIGDEGRSSLVGKSVNIILMLDTSGSMSDQIAFGSGTTSRIAALRLAVHNLLDELAASHADNVRVDLISFNTSATSLGIFDLKDLTELDAALDTIDQLSAGGNTNYEAALQAALNWVHSTGSDAPLTGANVVNQAIFVSDGEPNSWLNAQNTSLSGSNVRDGLSSTAIAQFLGTYNPSGTSSDDRVSEVALLENLFGPIEAVGINVGTSALDILNQVEGVASNVVPDAATNITTAEQLDQVLADLNPEVQFSPAGRDTINGGEGSDILFGDAPFTDDLADVAGLGTAAGGGWQVFTELEAHKGQGSYADWDRSDTLDYINSHLDELSQESGRLAGADILDGGAGDDYLFGQEGNDQLIGGTGNDTMSGGSGADTFIWRAADADGSEDVIKDFTIGEDKLDLQAVLDPTSDPLSDYLDISANTDGDAVVKVFKTGDMSATPDLTIVLEGMGTDNTELAQLQDYLLIEDGVIK